MAIVLLSPPYVYLLSAGIHHVQVCSQQSLKKPTNSICAVCDVCGTVSCPDQLCSHPLSHLPGPALGVPGTEDRGSCWRLLQGLGEEQGALEPTVSLSAPKEPLTVKKQIFLPRSSILGAEHPSLGTDILLLSVSEGVKSALMAAMCAQLSTEPAWAGLSPVAVDVIESDGHSTGSARQAVLPSLLPGRAARPRPAARTSLACRTQAAAGGSRDSLNSL